MELRKACVQESVDTEPVYLEGPCLISRSLALHPGDGKLGVTFSLLSTMPIPCSVQQVYAVGKPPEDKICFFRDLKNVVVLAAVGTSCWSYECKMKTYRFQEIVPWHHA